MSTMCAPVSFEKNMLNTRLMRTASGISLSFVSVSHTTGDLVFIWDPMMPLDVNKDIELPQLELISTKNDDCSTEYSTGRMYEKYVPGHCPAQDCSSQST